MLSVDLLETAVHGRGRQRQQQHRENRSNLAQCPDPLRFGLLLITDHIPKPNLPATWGRSEGRNACRIVFLNILEREKLGIELYAPEITPNSSEHTPDTHEDRQKCSSGYSLSSS